MSERQYGFSQSRVAFGYLMDLTCTAERAGQTSSVDRRDNIATTLMASLLLCSGLKIVRHISALGIELKLSLNSHSKFRVSVSGDVLFPLEMNCKSIIRLSNWDDI